jgi:hypothetical protein
MKPGYLGPAFHSYLEWLEYVEAALMSGKVPRRQRYVTMNDRLFHVANEEDMARVVNETMPVDAYLARVVRSSVKYKMDFATIMDISARYESELNYIRKNYQMRLPHEWCTVIIEGIGPDTFIIVAQDQISDEEYGSLNIHKGDNFMCANIAFYRQTGLEIMPGQEGFPQGGIKSDERLSQCPIELHMRQDDTQANNTFLHAVPEGLTVTDAGKTAIDMVRECFLVWLHQFHLQSILHSKTIGGALPDPGKGYQRSTLRKRQDHPKFEHTIITMEIDAPESAQVGRSMFQPHKRLHQVRGFWRRIQKTGKKVWVKPHWRGDEKLGVVRRDVELITHNEGEHNEHVTKAIRSEPAGQTGQSGRTGNRSVFRDGSDSIWHRTRKALGAAWVSVVRAPR